MAPEDTAIEGLGHKFQEARKARGLSIDEAARLTKIRQSRLVEIEADDFSNFPNLAYAKGFLQIYGKFLEVDVTPYLDAFETPGQITVDGYSYLQDNPVPKPARAAASRPAASESGRPSLLLFLVGLGVLVLGLWFIRLILNVQRISPHTVATAAASPTASAGQIIAPRALPVDTPPPRVAATVAPTAAPVLTTPEPAAVVAATPLPRPSASQPEVRRAQPVRPEDLVAANEINNNGAEKAGPNRVDIRPLKKTYVQVTVNDDPTKPVFERWISPSDGAVEFYGKRISVRVLDREAVQIRKNGKVVSADDPDVTIE